MKLGPFPTNAPWGSSAIQAWLDRIRQIYNNALDGHIGAGGTDEHPIFTTTEAGFTPASGSVANKFLRDDGTWQTVSIPAATQSYTLATDESTAADTNPVSLTDLTFAFEAGGTYAFRIVGNVSPAAATTGCGFQMLIS